MANDKVTKRLTGGNPDNAKLDLSNVGSTTIGSFNMAKDKERLSWIQRAWQVVAAAYVIAAFPASILSFYLGATFGDAFSVIFGLVFLVLGAIGAVVMIHS